MKFHLLIILPALPAVAMGGGCDMSPSIKDVKTNMATEKEFNLAVFVRLEDRIKDAIRIELTGIARMPKKQKKAKKSPDFMPKLGSVSR